MKKFIIIALIVALVALLLTVFQNQFGNQLINVQTKLDNNSSSPTASTQQTKIIAENLDVPWAIDFLPNDQIIFTQRSGAISVIDTNGDISPIANIDINNVGEGGLLGIAVDPDFNNNNYIYTYYTYSSSGENTLNKVSRFTLENNQLINEKVLVDNIAGASNHDGGRIKFGPDGYLYITTGDAQVPSRSQDINSLSGKILRVTKDGTAAPGNPFKTRIYSWGHRNPQGIAWDNNGNLWSTEHGRSGIESGLDELNLIKAGVNYGWPTIEGNETKSGMETAIINSGANDTWAPAGLTYLNGKFYFGGLRGSALYEYNPETKKLNEYFKNELGRIREVIVGPNNLLYITTSNKDGRGDPKSGDDKIIQVNPEKLNVE